MNLNTLEEIKAELQVVSEELESSVNELSQIDISTLNLEEVESKIRFIKQKIYVLSMKRLALAELSRTKVSISDTQYDIYSIQDRKDKDE